jgi:hypothetical protein
MRGLLNPSTGPRRDEREQEAKERSSSVRGAFKAGCMAAEDEQNRTLETEDATTALTTRSRELAAEAKEDAM